MFPPNMVRDAFIAFTVLGFVLGAVVVGVGSCVASRYNLSVDVEVSDAHE